MKMKHTKGPWVDRNKGIAHAGGEVYAANEYICTTSGNAKANAQLIAAAPDLLEALKEMKMLYEYAYEKQWGHEPMPENCPPIERAINAIAKATGEKEGDL